MDLFWETVIILAAIILILILYKFGSELKKRDSALMAKHFDPKH